MSIFIILIEILCQVLFWVILIRVILSWFSIGPDNPVLIVLDQITEPVLAPLRRIVPRIGILDITPMVAMLLLLLIPRILRIFS